MPYPADIVTTTLIKRCRDSEVEPSKGFLAAQNQHLFGPKISSIKDVVKIRALH